jgi:S-ribosylhomocysteine lyase LuxS involved in autoinducer biosynthesis
MRETAGNDDSIDTIHCCIAVPQKFRLTTNEAHGLEHVLLTI